jgi:hypothetical protein
MGLEELLWLWEYCWGIVYCVVFEWGFAIRDANKRSRCCVFGSAFMEEGPAGICSGYGLGYKRSANYKRI